MIVQSYKIDCYYDDACRAAEWSTSNADKGNEIYKEKFSAIESDDLPFYVPNQDYSVWINVNVMAYHSEQKKFYSDKTVSKKIKECLAKVECKSEYQRAHGLTQKQAVLSKYVELPRNYIVVPYTLPESDIPKISMRF